MDTNLSDSTTGPDISTESRSRHEDKLTSEIEKRTANIPSIAFLVLAGASIAGSLSCYFMDKKHASLLIGEWVPTFLILGLYNKLVKQAEVIKAPMSPLTEGH
jgi:hypothetical protein